MKRRQFLTFAIAGVTMAGAAQAESFADAVIAQLTRQGFAQIASGSTWLGRIRITAQRNGGMREIVLNPRTGEILRDIWTPAGGTTAQIPIVDDVSDTGDDGSSGDGGSDGGGTSGGGTSGGGDSGSGGSGGSDDGSGGDGGDDHGGKGKD